MSTMPAQRRATKSTKPRKYKHIQQNGTQESQDGKFWQLRTLGTDRWAATQLKLRVFSLAWAFKRLRSTHRGVGSV